MYAHQNVYSRPFQYAGARPWVEYNPFTSCSCSNLTPSKLLIREECLYCPCIGGGSDGSQREKGVQYDQKDGLLCIYMLNLLLNKQKERMVLNGRKEREQHNSSNSQSSHNSLFEHCYAVTVDEM